MHRVFFKKIHWKRGRVRTKNFLFIKSASPLNYYLAPEYETLNPFSYF